MISRGHFQPQLFCDSFCELGVAGKTGILEEEATSGPEALWHKPEVQEKSKRRSQKEEASHSEEYRRKFTYWKGPFKVKELKYAMGPKANTGIQR